MKTIYTVIWGEPEHTPMWFFENRIDAQQFINKLKEATGSENFRIEEDPLVSSLDEINEIVKTISNSQT